MSKYNYNFSKNDYKTPPVLYQMALDTYGIDKFGLDACCTDENIPAEKYYKFGENDGLKEQWEIHTWCNPPFNECKKWIKKAFQEQQDGNTTIMLIPVRTETKYWHEYILFNPNVEIKWLRKGYQFINPETQKPMGVFKNALALVYFNPRYNTQIRHDKK